jgi:hypothetical protein
VSNGKTLFMLSVEESHRLPVGWELLQRRPVFHRPVLRLDALAQVLDARLGKRARQCGLATPSELTGYPKPSVR